MLHHYWTPYRGIDTLVFLPIFHSVSYWTPYRGIDTISPISLWPRNLYWTPYRGLILVVSLLYFKVVLVHSIEPLIGGLIQVASCVDNQLRIDCFAYWTPYRGLRHCKYADWASPEFCYWTPYRGIDTTLREWAISNEKVGIKCSFAFLRKGSGGGVVYGFGVWRVKSWVKNVPNTNKYIAVFSVEWGWSRLTYLPLVGIIFEKNIILFYWTPYRGIETFRKLLHEQKIHLLNPL